MVPSRASRRAGRSYSGSPSARFPPIVARFRSWASPMDPAVSARAGNSSPTRPLVAISLRVVIAPIRSAPSWRSTPFSEATRRRSTRTVSFDRSLFRSRRIFWPPASGRASERAAKTATASSTDSGAAYSNALMSISSHCSPDLLGGGGDINVAHTEFRQGVANRIDDRRSYCRLRDVTRPLRAHSIQRRGSNGAIQFEFRHVARARYRIRIQISRQQPSVLVVDHLFRQGRTDPEGDAAVHLPLDYLRISHEAYIVDTDVAYDFRRASFPVDLDDGYVSPEWEVKVRRIEIGGHFQSRLHSSRHI